jgi:addiction module RelE/StbE family toxin
MPSSIWNESSSWLAWGLRVSKKFKAGYKRLKGGTLMPRVKQGMDLLTHSDNPRELGEKKSGEYGEFWAYAVNDDCRILYGVNDQEHRVEFHRVCSHKETYT